MLILKPKSQRGETERDRPPLDGQKSLVIVFDAVQKRVILFEERIVRHVGSYATTGS